MRKFIVIVLTLVAVVAGGFAVQVFSSKASGWEELAQAYPYQGQRLNATARFHSVNIWTRGNYNCCVTLGMNNDGLYAAMIAPLSWAHPPVFIPWSEITPFGEGRYMGEPTLDVDLKRIGFRLRLRGKFVTDIAARLPPMSAR